MIQFSRGAVLAFCLVGLTACGSVNEPEGTGMPEMSMEEMMSAMEQLGAPSDGHSLLTRLAGDYDTVSTFYMDPETEPEVTYGHSVNTMVMGGRYLQQIFRGEAMGKSFAGLGFTGFNNASGQYEGVWLDDMSTTIMPVSVGSLSDDGHVLTFRRAYADPITGMETQTREVITMHDDDHYRFEWFQAMPDGSEMLTMSIEYARS